MREIVELVVYAIKRDPDGYSSKSSANSAEVILFIILNDFLVKIKRLRKRLSIKIKQAELQECVVELHR